MLRSFIDRRQPSRKKVQPACPDACSIGPWFPSVFANCSGDMAPAGRFFVFQIAPVAQNSVFQNEKPPGAPRPPCFRSVLILILIARWARRPQFDPVSRTHAFGGWTRFGIFAKSCCKPPGPERAGLRHVFQAGLSEFFVNLCFSLNCHIIRAENKHQML